mmetsp:Transcript_928/g.3418  ORF Transcript_928/g.3418 Transcript_928/m.3418 type:complete len:225 (+) Transcript_928:789-1463(+)
MELAAAQPQVDGSAAAAGLPQHGGGGEHDVHIRRLEHRRLLGNAVVLQHQHRIMEAAGDAGGAAVRAGMPHRSADRQQDARARRHRRPRPRHRRHVLPRPRYVVLDEGEGRRVCAAERLLGTQPLLDGRHCLHVRRHRRSLRPLLLGDEVAAAAVEGAGDDHGYGAGGGPAVPSVRESDPGARGGGAAGALRRHSARTLSHFAPDGVGVRPMPRADGAVGGSLR